MRKAPSVSFYEAECETEESVCAKVIHTGMLESLYDLNIRSSYKLYFRVRWTQIYTWVDLWRNLRKILKLLSILGECAAKLEDSCEELYPLSDYCSFCKGNLCNEGSSLKSSLLTTATFIIASCGKLFLSRSWISHLLSESLDTVELHSPKYRDERYNTVLVSFSLFFIQN